MMIMYAQIDEFLHSIFCNLWVYFLAFYSRLKITALVFINNEKQGQSVAHWKLILKNGVFKLKKVMLFQVVRASNKRSYF